MLNENWVREDTFAENRKRAKLAVRAGSHRKLEKGERVILIPHPTIKKTWIEKIVKNEIRS